MHSEPWITMLGATGSYRMLRRAVQDQQLGMLHAACPCLAASLLAISFAAQMSMQQVLKA